MSVASLALLGAIPAAAAEQVSAQDVEAILGGLRTGPITFERTVILDSRSIGTPLGDYDLHDRYTELHQRETPRRARIVARSAHRPGGFTVTRYDGEIFLAAGDEPARRAGGPVRRLLDGMMPIPIRAEDVAAIETMPTDDGGSRVRVRFKRPDPSRIIGRSGRSFLAPQIAPEIRGAEESAELLLSADGGLLRLTQRFRATLDGDAIALGVPTLGPQGITRLRFGATLQVAATPQAPVAPPAAKGAVTDEDAFALLPEPDIPAVAVIDSDAAPSGNARAIRLARRANAGLRDASAFTAALRGNLPGASGVVRVEVGLHEGLVDVARTSLGAGGEVVSAGRSQFTFDPIGHCWDREPLTSDPFTPWVPGRAPIPLRGTRFFAPEPAGRLVRIVVERAVAGFPTRARYTLDRQSGRLLAAETLLTKGRVTIRPDLTVEPPTPVC